METVRDFKKQRHCFVNTGPSSQSYGFSSSHESWIIKRKLDAFATVVLEKTLESPLDCKETQPILPEGNQS